MALTPAMTVYDLLVAHPFLDGFLVAYHPVFAGLAATRRRETWGRMVTLGELAVVMDIPWRVFLRDVRAEVERVTGIPPALVDEMEAHEEDAKGEEVRGLVGDLERGAPLADLARRMDAATGGLDDVQVAALARRRRRDGRGGDELLGVPVAASAARGLGPGHPVTALRRECERVLELAAHLEEAVERFGEGRRGVQTAPLALLDRLDEIGVQRERLRRAWYPTLGSRGGRGPSALVDGQLEDVVRLGARLRRALEREEPVTVRATAGRYLDALRSALASEEVLLMPLALRTLDREDWEALGEQERVVGWALLGAGGEEPSP